VFVKRFAILLTMLCGLAGSAMAIAPSASAQEADYDLQVIVSICEATSCDDVEPELLADAEVVVMSETGEEYGTCTTVTDVKPGGCSVMVPAGSTVEVAVLTESIPDGYVALDSPQTYQVPEEKTAVGDVWLELTLQDDTVPDDADTDEEAAGDEMDDEADADTEAPTELPSTGAGPSSPVDGRITGVLAMLALGSLLLARRVRLTA
jgi:hypothetical protein